MATAFKSNSVVVFMKFFAVEMCYGGGRKWEGIMRHDSGKSGDVRSVV